MKKKLLLVAIVLFAFCFASFAQNKACVDYENGRGLAVFISSMQDPSDTDPTVVDYINTITVSSNGNKMRIISVGIKDSKGRIQYLYSCPILGKIIEPYGSVQFTYKTHNGGLKANSVIVKAEGCN